RGAGAERERARARDGAALPRGPRAGEDPRAARLVAPRARPAREGPRDRRARGRAPDGRGGPPPAPHAGAGGEGPDAAPPPRRRPAARRLARAGAVRRRATWAATDVVASLRRAGIPARESRDAGGFLCNAVLYAALSHPVVRRKRLPVTFLHVPIPGAGARPDA